MTYIYILPLIGILHLILGHGRTNLNLKQIALVYSCLPLVLLLGNTLSYNFIHSGFSKESFLTVNDTSIEILLDGLSFPFLLLTSIIFPLCVLTSWNSINSRIKEYYITILSLQSMLYFVFSLIDMLLFYVFFEAVLIPMFLIIGIWGSRSRKIHASYQFFIYTLAGSLFMLLSILLIYSVYGTLDYTLISYLKLSPDFQKLLWLGFFISFAIKVPMVPFHIWLPEAHVEAPTSGSIILAAILLKLGTYGLARFSIGLFPEASIYFSPLVFIMSILGIVYGSLTTIRQIDLKKIIAYSSVAHMGYVTLGLFSFNTIAVEGSIFLMLGHGVVSGSLFYSIGVIYDRYGTRLISYYGGLIKSMPLFSLFFLLFTLSNISFPGTINFVGEIMVIIGSFYISPTLCIIASIGTALGAVYSIWAYNRICSGTNNSIIWHFDVSRREFFILAIFAILIIWLGIFPNYILSFLHSKSILYYFH